MAGLVHRVPRPHYYPLGVYNPGVQHHCAQSSRIRVLVGATVGQGFRPRGGGRDVELAHGGAGIW